jgi:trimethylamine:corrinoid methyltransferase-like protein
MDRQNYSNWEGSGSKPMRQRVNERVKEILDTHRVEPLRDEVEKTIEKVFKKYGRRA